MRIALCGHSNIYVKHYVDIQTNAHSVIWTFKHMHTVFCGYSNICVQRCVDMQKYAYSVMDIQACAYNVMWTFKNMRIAFVGHSNIYVERYVDLQLFAYSVTGAFKRLRTVSCRRWNICVHSVCEHSNICVGCCVDMVTISCSCIIEWIHTSLFYLVIGRKIQSIARTRTQRPHHRHSSHAERCYTSRRYHERIGSNPWLFDTFLSGELGIKWAEEYEGLFGVVSWHHP